MVHYGYAYPSALLWADLLINKVGPKKKTGISPDPAAESKAGYILYRLVWRATVACPLACTLWPSAGARRGQDAGSALLRNEAVHTVLLGHVR